MACGRNLVLLASARYRIQSLDLARAVARIVLATWKGLGCSYLVRTAHCHGTGSILGWQCLRGWGFFKVGSHQTTSTDWVETVSRVYVSTQVRLGTGVSGLEVASHARHGLGYASDRDRKDPSGLRCR